MHHVLYNNFPGLLPPCLCRGSKVISKKKSFTGRRPGLKARLADKHGIAVKNDGGTHGI